MGDRGNQSQAQEGRERRLPQHKTREKIEVDEGFVKSVGEEGMRSSPHPKSSSAPADPSRMRSVRQRRKTLIRKRKLLD